MSLSGVDDRPNQQTLSDTKGKDVKAYLATFIAGLLLACPVSAKGFSIASQDSAQGTTQSGDSPELAEAEQLSVQLLSLYKERKYDKALPLAERVLAIRERVLGPNHPLVARALRSLSEILYAKGKRKEALSTYERYIGIAEKAYVDDRPRLVDAFDRYVCMLAFSGQPSESLEVQKRLYKIENEFDYDESDTKVNKARLAGGGLMQGRLIHSPAPYYPAEAKSARISGSVIMKITVDETGRVVAVNTLCGHSLLAKAAEESISKSLYMPTLVNGKPVKVTGIVRYTFVLQ